MQRHHVRERHPPEVIELDQHLLEHEGEIVELLCRKR
jgi:hypothetical protein